MWVLGTLEMKIVDIYDSKRVSREPDEIDVLFESGNFLHENFSILRVELRHYIEKTDEVLGPYSLITSFVDTDKGSVEMIYDEGFRGIDSLSRTGTQSRP